MGRQWRIEFEGAFYHVLSRGNDGKLIFSDDTDRIGFLNLLGDLCERFEIDMFAYVLMPNHYHILLTTRRANLSKAMQWLGTTYTRYYNNKNSCRGHLFQGRYKSILVENDVYLSRLSCYIHRNPLRAGLVKRLIQYRWSSYPAYAYGKDHPKWLQTQLILSLSTAKDRHLAYRRKVQRYADERRRIWEDMAHGFIYGSQEFVDWLKARFLPSDPEIEIPLQRKLLKDVDPNEMADQIARIAGSDIDYFKKTEKISSSRRLERDQILFVLWQTGLFTNQQIADVFNLSFSMVSHAVHGFRKKISEHSDLKRKTDTLITQTDI